jgi:dihydroorotase-like cyclic amidohydrolase
VDTIVRNPSTNLAILGPRGSGKTSIAPTIPATDSSKDPFYRKNTSGIATTSFSDETAAVTSGGVTTVLGDRETSASIANAASSNDMSALSTVGAPTANSAPKIDHLHCDLAPAFGDLTNKTLKEMNDAMQVSVIITMKFLSDAQERTPGEISWDQVLNILRMNPVLGLHGAQVSRSDEYTRNQNSWFNINSRKPDATAVEAARPLLLLQFTGS